MQIIKTAGLIFECENEIEVMRAQTLLTKEPGTIAWLEKSLQPHDVFWDIGANIGVYTLFAAQRGATVCAFEPHLANARSLLRNLRANQVVNVMVTSSPLGARDGWQLFRYANDAAGASGSQLGLAIDEYGRSFEPVASEMKWVTTGDRFATDVDSIPTLVKIDIDGLELEVLHGMFALLRYRSPRSLQVEIHDTTNAEIVTFLKQAGYHLDHRHHTANGQQAIAKGVDPMTVPHNAVFVR